MSFINFIRLVSPAGETWEEYTRRKWGVGVTRYHGWFDGKVEKAWTKILSRPDASLRWKALLKKGWRETQRRNPNDKWTKIGEWWIDDSGTALYADGDNGDMGHEAYIIDMITRSLLEAMDVEPWNEECVGDLNDGHNRKRILEKMKEAEFTGVIEEFVEQAAKKLLVNLSREAAQRLQRLLGEKLSLALAKRSRLGLGKLLPVGGAVVGGSLNALLMRGAGEAMRHTARHYRSFLDETMAVEEVYVLVIEEQPE